MGYLKIHCKNCRKSWAVYHRDNWHDERARQCPFCYSEIDKDLWEREIIPAFGAMSDANREILKNYTGFPDKSMFLIDYRANRELMKR